MTLPEDDPYNSYKSSVWRASRSFQSGATVCEFTGARAIKGRCPVHNGDACLYDSSVLITYWREQVDG